MEKRLGVHLPTKKTRGNYKKRKVDRMSELPDHILGLILSHLSMKEAARTSIVSSRWRDVWIIRDTVLDFHDRSITLRDYDSMPTPTEFIDRVDEVLKKHKEPTLSEFIVKSDWLFDSNLSKSILNWIYFAIRKRVQRLDLALSNLLYLETFHERTMAIWINSTVRCHGHSFPSLNFLITKVEGFSRFVTTLKVLRLKCFDVDGELLEYLLSNCPILEHLSVSYSKSLVDVQVRAPSTVKLKYFEIYDCYRSQTIHFDDAPNLECIRFSGSLENISIKSAPNLINVCLVNTRFCFCILNNARHLSNNLSQLEVLTLEFESKYGSPPESFRPFPILTHLKHLILKLQRRYNCLDLNNLFIAMPSLYRLHLTVEEEMTPVMKSTCCHKCLKLVEWDGYIGDFGDCSFVRFLAQTCKVLEKITISKGKWLRPVGYDEEGCVEYEKLSMQMLEGVEVIIHQSQKLSRLKKKKK